MKKSITLKLFLITGVVFLLFISIIMLLQLFLFKNYYANNKIKAFETEFLAFKKAYEQSIWVDQRLIRAELPGFVYHYTAKTKALVAILSTSDNHLQIINNLNDLWHGYFKFPIPPLTETSYTSIVGETRYPNWEQIYNASLIRDCLNKTRSYSQVIVKHKTIKYTTDHYYNNMKNIVMISPVVINNQVTKVIFSFASLQPIDDAMGALKVFYIYFFLLAILLSTGLSLVFSKTITKPLLHLNQVAERMANLDFRAKSAINSQDELGNLGHNLNFLSENLRKTLQKLTAANKQLKKDIAQEKKLEKMRKEFIASISHELKTPISLVCGYTEALKDNLPAAEERDFYLEVIMDESQKMNRLINEMLELSHLKSGNLQLELQPLDLKHFLAAITKKMRPQLDRKKVTFITTYPGDDWHVVADRFRLEQVFNNLLSNALRHTPAGGWIRLTLTAEKTLVSVAIENNGPPIPEELIGRIWDQFYRIEASHNKDTGGTGLGLAIVKNILLLHQSDFGVTNTKEGVQFYFTLSRKILLPTNAS